MTWDQMSRCASAANYIEELRAILIVDGNFTKFKRRLDELGASTDQEFDIMSLGGCAFMWEGNPAGCGPVYRRASRPWPAHKSGSSV